MPRPFLLVTSNGAGLGHLSRMTALGEALRARGCEPVLCSMSAALPLVAGATGTRGEYVPSPDRRWVDRRRWHRYFAGRLVALVRELDAAAVVFDGVVPYAGLLVARRELADVPFVWSRRGFWKPGANRGSLRGSAAFDLVVEPGDLCGAADHGATRGAAALRVAPISLAATYALLDRAEARGRLGLHPDRPAALVMLGTSIRGDLSRPGDAALGAVLADPRWQVAVTDVPLDGRDGWQVDATRVVALHGTFPLVPLLGAFDVAVASAGYNAVHELLPCRVPTLLVAKHRGVDDQQSRAREAAARGWALAASDTDPNDVAARATELLDAGVGAALSAACGTLPAVDGADAAADALLSLASPRSVHRTSAVERTYRSWSVLRTSVGSRRRSEVRTEAPRWVFGDVGYDALRGPRPVEHVLAGASQAYVQRRRELADRAYRDAPAGG